MTSQLCALLRNCHTFLSSSNTLHNQGGSIVGTEHIPESLGLDQPACDVAISDEAAVEAALLDRRWFRLLYERYADRLYWYTTTRTGSATIADDVVSETMLTALEQLDRFDPARGSFASWLFTIGYRKVIDQQRYHRRFFRYVAGRDSRRDLAAEQDALDNIIRHERAAEVHAALSNLSRSDQEVIGLRYSAGLSTSEIADVLDISPAATRQRLSRAVRRLGQEMRVKEGDR